MARILVIDDEESVREAVTQALRAGGHEVIQAAGGSEGLKRQAELPADVVITDMYMPGQDGVGVIVQLRRLAPHVPIIAITGNPMGDMLMVAQKLGAVGVLEKPFGVKELLELIEKALKWHERNL